MESGKSPFYRIEVFVFENGKAPIESAFRRGIIRASDDQMAPTICQLPPLLMLLSPRGTWRLGNSFDLSFCHANPRPISLRSRSLKGGLLLLLLLRFAFAESVLLPLAIDEWPYIDRCPRPMSILLIFLTETSPPSVC
jgi:hypothetical protein